MVEQAVNFRLWMHFIMLRRHLLRQLENTFSVERRETEHR